MTKGKKNETAKLAKTPTTRGRPRKDADNRKAGTRVHPRAKGVRKGAAHKSSDSASNTRAQHRAAPTPARKRVQKDKPGEYYDTPTLELDKWTWWDTLAVVLIFGVPLLFGFVVGIVVAR